MSSGEEESGARGTKRSFLQEKESTFDVGEAGSDLAFQNFVAERLDLDGLDHDIMEFVSNHDGVNYASGEGSSVASRTNDELPQVVTNRLPILMYLSCNDDFMSPYQCLLRKQIEFFQAHPQDVETNAQGRNKPIVLGQVGIRCRYCALSPQKTRGAVLYPSKLVGVYQTAQNMAKIHLMQHCQTIPEPVKHSLLKLKDSGTSEVGKEKWGKMTEALGIYEDSYGLRFTPYFG